MQYRRIEYNATMSEDHPRLFFALQIRAPWPEVWPKGRIIEEPFRHNTLAFLKQTPLSDLEKTLLGFPKPSFQIAPCALFQKCHILPEKTPRVVAWEAKWFDDAIIHFRENLISWLKEKGFAIDMRPWLSHVTVCRTPFNPKAWMDSFSPLPCFSLAIHLYKSLGYSKYQSLWSLPFHPPFEEKEHMADLAFSIYGKDLKQIYTHAFTALAFECPDLSSYFIEKEEIQSIEEIVMLLNESTRDLDCHIGCPFKAISFHGQLHEIKPNILMWEMIVDV